MIEVHREILNDIPYLHIVKSEEKEKEIPLVMFVHGFTSAKEHNLHFAYSLAEKGIRTLLPEAVLHGEREIGLSDQERMVRFWEIVLHTIDELDVLKNHFMSKGLVKEDKIGLVGTSMGGIITFGALTKYKWIKAAVSLMGTPKYEQFAKLQIDQLESTGMKLPLSKEELAKQIELLRTYDLSEQPELLANRPLLIWHGKKDKLVPFALTDDFYEQIKELYPEDQIEYMTEENTEHKVSREAYIRTVEWFDEQLNK